MRSKLATGTLTVVILISLFSSGGSDSAEEWCYGGKKACGPKNWKGKCRFGSAQSPIDIVTARTKKVTSGGKLKLSSSYSAANQFTIQNNGHTVQFELSAPTTKLIVEGTGWRGKYQFKQMHFHWGSEHLINGKRFPLELHLVHEQVNGKGGIGVLGIIFAVSDEDNAALKPIIDALPSVAAVSDKIDMDGTVNLDQILPPVRDVFRYKGSLTTPPCSEEILWSVFTQRVTISRKQLAAFKIKNSDGNLILSNARPAKPAFTKNRKSVYWLPARTGK